MLSAHAQLKYAQRGRHGYVLYICGIVLYACMHPLCRLQDCKEEVCRLQLSETSLQNQLAAANEVCMKDRGREGREGVGWKREGGGEGERGE